MTSGPKNHPDRLATYCAPLFAGSVVSSILLGGGLLVRTLVEWTIPSAGFAVDFRYHFGASAVSLAVTVLTGIVLVRSRNRRPLWAALTILASFILTVACSEFFLRAVTPAWPACYLHGVTPAQWKITASETHAEDNAVGLNSWGERDAERSLIPPPGMRRIAFIGDSFLEEGASRPLSLETETGLHRSDVEVINLGVSATGPDEYFDRLRGVAQPLGVSHCCLFIYAGNDFVAPARTLPSYWNIASVAPRPGFLEWTGLRAWNHVLTNQRRPVIETWLRGSTLAADELQRGALLRHASSDDMRLMLLGAAGFTGEARERLAAKLRSETIEPFFEMLRHPDHDRFRSYYLGDALRAAADAHFKWEPNSELIAWQWTEQAAEVCRRYHIGLTLILIPEAFQVDDRMREQWLPLADMRICTAPSQDAANRFVTRARDAGLDIVDLQAHLKGTRGTYLNLDGHWSEHGVAKVARILVQHPGLGSPAIPRKESH